MMVIISEYENPTNGRQWISNDVWIFVQKYSIFNIYETLWLFAYPFLYKRGYSTF